MKDRIKALRKELHLNQTEFGERVALRQSTITGYETGTREPSDAVIKALCNTYHVNEDWLRNGNGEMFVQMSHKEKTVKFMSDIAMMNGLDPEEGLTARIIDFLADMSLEEWKTIASLAERWYQLEKEARDPEDPDGRD